MPYTRIRIIISAICILTIATVSTAPMKRKCIPCAVFCSTSNPEVTGSSCWSCQCEPPIESSYKPATPSCSKKPCKKKCDKRSLKLDARGCPICQCDLIPTTQNGPS
ncbi:uncharacterized protein LOC117322960 [Pecten maximus]|uniref:uncharacterized protein LOC117322960 n=1 Tax=Pecten maximus TaxID=6579 RepID=UPI00145918FA|nr:uncharacterized protein LOC117322960 [Pecten maximus]